MQGGQAVSQKRQACDVCGAVLTLSWTDRHGIAVCCRCGIDYDVQGFNGNQTTAVRLHEDRLQSFRDYWAAQATKFPFAFTGRPPKRPRPASGLCGCTQHEPVLAAEMWPG